MSVRKKENGGRSIYEVLKSQQSPEMSGFRPVVDHVDFAATYDGPSSSDDDDSEHSEDTLSVSSNPILCTTCDADIMSAHTNDKRCGDKVSPLDDESDCILNPPTEITVSRDASMALQHAWWRKSSGVKPETPSVDRTAVDTSLLPSPIRSQLMRASPRDHDPQLCGVEVGVSQESGYQR